MIPVAVESQENGQIVETKIKTCSKHGEFESIGRKFPMFGKPFYSGCQKCAEERKQEEEAEQEENRLRAIQNRMQRMGIKKKYFNSTLDSYQATSEKQKHALTTCQRYLSTFSDRLYDHKGMVFCGNTGTGKTHLAVGMIKQLAKDKHDALLVSVMDMIREIRRAYSERQFTEQELIEKFVDPDLLFIDEIGVQLGTEAEKVTLYDVINKRYEEMKPTIILSNLEREKVREYIGARSYSRIINGGIVLSFDWNDYRV